MDVIEVPSHFMENYVNDARTLPLFMPDSNSASTARKAEAMAKQVKQDRHMFGALDLETQASFVTCHTRVFTCHLRAHTFCTHICTSPVSLCLTDLSLHLILTGSLLQAKTYC